MSIRENYDFEFLVNEAERLVLDQLELQLKDVPEAACQCQDCVLDMAAFALNSAKPLYRVSLLGTLYAKALDGSDYERELSDSVAQAISRVTHNPSHG